MKKWVQHLHKGVEAAKQGDLDTAEAHYRETLRLNPTNTDALLNLSGIYYYRGNFHRALELVEECISTDPVRLQAHHQRGMVRSAMGDLSGALSDFDTELRLHPDDLEAILSRGLTLSQLGNTTDARASYEQAMHWRPRILGHTITEVYFVGMGRTRMERFPTSRKRSIAIRATRRLTLAADILCG